MKPKVWTYVGDMKCPLCGIFHKVMRNGRGNSMKLRMRCALRGIVFVKVIGNEWQEESQFWDSYKQGLLASVGRR